MAYSLIEQISLDKVEFWLNKVNESISNGVPILLVGTKQDLVNQDQENRVQIGDVEEIKFKFGLTNSIETSAKTGENIDLAFQILVRNIYQKYQEETERLSKLTAEDRYSLNLETKNRPSILKSNQKKTNKKQCC